MEINYINMSRKPTERLPLDQLSEEDQKSIRKLHLIAKGCVVGAVAMTGVNFGIQLYQALKRP